MSNSITKCYAFCQIIFKRVTKSKEIPNILYQFELAENRCSLLSCKKLKRLNICEMQIQSTTELFDLGILFFAYR